MKFFVVSWNVVAYPPGAVIKVRFDADAAKPHVIPEEGTPGKIDFPFTPVIATLAIIVVGMVVIPLGGEIIENYVFSNNIGMATGSFKATGSALGSWSAPPFACLNNSRHTQPDMSTTLFFRGSKVTDNPKSGPLEILLAVTPDKHPSLTATMPGRRPIRFDEKSCETLHIEMSLKDDPSMDIKDTSGSVDADCGAENATLAGHAEFRNCD
jgi:hypothetical protein